MKKIGTSVKNSTKPTYDLTNVSIPDNSIPILVSLQYLQISTQGILLSFPCFSLSHISPPNHCEVGELCSCLMLQKEHSVQKIKPPAFPQTSKSVMKENLKSEADDSCSASSKPSSKARFAPCAIRGVIA